MVDFKVENHFTLFLLKPVSDEAKEWVGMHLPDDTQTFGDAIAVEHRYIGAIVEGIRETGLTVDDGFSH